MATLAATIPSLATYRPAPPSLSPHGTSLKETLDYFHSNYSGNDFRTHTRRQWARFTQTPTPALHAALQLFIDHLNALEFTYKSLRLDNRQLILALDLPDDWRMEAWQQNTGVNAILDWVVGDDYELPPHLCYMLWKCGVTGEVDEVQVGGLDHEKGV